MSNPGAPKSKEWWVEVVEGLSKSGDVVGDDRELLNDSILDQLKRNVGDDGNKNLIDLIAAERARRAQEVKVIIEEGYDNLLDPTVALVNHILNPEALGLEALQEYRDLFAKGEAYFTQLANDEKLKDLLVKALSDEKAGSLIVAKLIEKFPDEEGVDEDDAWPQFDPNDPMEFINFVFGKINGDDGYLRIAPHEEPGASKLKLSTGIGDDELGENVELSKRLEELITESGDDQLGKLATLFVDAVAEGDHTVASGSFARIVGISISDEVAIIPDGFVVRTDAAATGIYDLAAAASGLGESDPDVEEESPFTSIFKEDLYDYTTAGMVSPTTEKRGSVLLSPLPPVPEIESSEGAQELKEVLKALVKEYNSNNPTAIAIVNQIGREQQKKRQGVNPRNALLNKDGGMSSGARELSVGDLQLAIKGIQNEYEIVAPRGVVYATLPAQEGGSLSTDSTLDAESVAQHGSEPVYEVASPAIGAPVAETETKITKLEHLEAYFSQMDGEAEVSGAVIEGGDGVYPVSRPMIAKLCHLQSQGVLKADEIKIKLLEACVAGLTHADFPGVGGPLFKTARQVFNAVDKVVSGEITVVGSEIEGFFEDGDGYREVVGTSSEAGSDGEYGDEYGFGDEDEAEAEAEGYLNVGPEIEPQGWNHAFIINQLNIPNPDPHGIIEQIESILKNKVGVYEVAHQVNTNERIYDLGGAGGETLVDNPKNVAKVRIALVWELIKKAETNLENNQGFAQYQKNTDFFIKAQDELATLDEDLEEKARKIADLRYNIFLALINSGVEGAQGYCDAALDVLERELQLPKPPAEPAPGDASSSAAPYSDVPLPTESSEVPTESSEVPTESSEVPSSVSSEASAPSSASASAPSSASVPASDSVPASASVPVSASVPDSVPSSASVPDLVPASASASAPPPASSVASVPASSAPVSVPKLFSASSNSASSSAPSSKAPALVKSQLQPTIEARDPKQYKAVNAIAPLPNLPNLSKNLSDEELAKFCARLVIISKNRGGKIEGYEDKLNLPKHKDGLGLATAFCGLTNMHNSGRLVTDMKHAETGIIDTRGLSANYLRDALNIALQNVATKPSAKNPGASSLKSGINQRLK